MATPAVTRLLRYALLATACGYVGGYLVLAWHRLSYPFELEWMEGAAVDHVARVLHGQSLYVAPQIAFVPFDYPPLYFYVSAVVARITGIGLFPLRLVSFASSLVCFASIYAIVKAETDGAYPAVLATGLFAATFRISGAWFDLARVDSLFLAFFLLAVLIMRRRESARGYVVAGAVLWLSFLTKQTALAMAVPIVLYTLYSRRRLGIWLAAALFGLVGVSTALFHVATDGWYIYYVFEFPFKYAWAPPVAVTFWTRDLIAQLPIAFTLAAACSVWQLRFRKGDLFWPMIVVGMIGGAYRSRLQTGGYDNVLFPAYAIVAIVFGFGVGALIEAVGRRQTASRTLAEVAIYAGCIVQMALLGYDPQAQLPRAADRAAGAQLLTALAGVHGDVLLPYHGYLPTVVGKPSHAHVMAVFDVLKLRDANSTALAQQFQSAIRQSAFDAIVLDDRANYPFMSEVNQFYVLKATVFSDPTAFFPVTGGIISRPDYLYVPRHPLGGVGAP